MRRKFNLCLALFCLAAPEVQAAIGGTVSGTTQSSITRNVIYANEGANLAALKNGARTPATIIVGPGTYYNCSNLLRAGLNWYGLPGATLTFTNTTNNGPGWGIFDDRFSGAVTSVIGGDFKFLWSAGLPGTNIDGTTCCYPTNVIAAVVTTNTTTELTLEFDRMDYDLLGTRAQGSAIFIKKCKRVFLQANAVEDRFYCTNFFVGLDEFDGDVYEASSGQGFYWEHGETFCNIAKISGAVYSAYAATDVGNSHSNLWFTSDHLLGKIYIQGDAAAATDWRTWWKVKVVETTTNNIGASAQQPIGILSGGRHYFDILKIAARDTAVHVTGGEVWLNVQKVTSPTKYINLLGGTLHATVQDWENLGGTVPIGQGVTVSGGQLVLDGPQLATNVAALVSGRYTNDSLGLLEGVIGLPNAPSAVLGRTNMLPSAVNYPRRSITVFDAGKTASGGGISNVWVQAPLSQTIARGPTLTNITANGGSLTLTSDGANWLISASWP